MARTIARPTVFTEGPNRLALAGSVALALLAAVFAFAALRALGGGGDDAGAVPDVQVVVSSQAIRAGDTIGDGMLKLATVPQDAATTNALTSLDGLVGLKALYPLEAGEQVTAAKLGQQSINGGSLGKVVPPNKRAVPVEVSEVQVFAGLLSPGDRVDVNAIIERTVNDQDVPTSVLLVQNAEVLAVAEEQLKPIGRLNIEGTPIATENSDGVLAASPDNADAQPKARNVTLSVSPEEAMLITLAQEEGSVWLILRGPDDNATQNIPPQSFRFE